MEAWLLTCLDIIGALQSKTGFMPLQVQLVLEKQTLCLEKSGCEKRLPQTKAYDFPSTAFDCCQNGKHW